MNKEAIAIAADSAATLTDTKIFQANKIFTLSKYAPVGVMIYGSSQFMGIPWETIIKEFRKKLSTKKFDSIQEYSKNFIEFLMNDNQMLSQDEQHNFFLLYLNGYFDFIIKQVKENVQKHIDLNKKVSEEEILEITSVLLKTHIDVWEKASLHPNQDSKSIDDFIIKNKKDIDESFTQKFEKIAQIFRSDPKYKKNYECIFQISACYFLKQSKDYLFPNLSGIVIAGFGEKEIFPSYVSFSIWMKVDNFLKYVEGIRSKITLQSPANIIPFAQGEMVGLFMEGIDPKYQQIIYSTIDELFKKYPEYVSENIGNLDVNGKKELISNLQGKNDAVFKEFINKLALYKQQYNVQPILDVVTNLPRDELAGMAESLVNLTSFKKRVSMQAENVGGPIDVAVITKGDGFIWIKRKHYFKSELNQQFFANYFKVEHNISNEGCE
jgi:hypothetical protein